MYSKIRKVDFGKTLDIKIVDYFVADADKVNEKELHNDLTEVCYDLRRTFESRMRKRGYSITFGDIKKRKFEFGVTLLDFLLTQTDVGEFVMISDEGWYVACTIIDNQNGFKKSLNNNILLRKVEKAEMITTKIGDTEIPAIRVEI